MNRTLALVWLVAASVAATSPVWAADGDNPSFSPDPATPGASVTFSGTVTPTPSPGSGGTCEVAAATPVAYACTYGPVGDVAGWLVVPSDWSSPALPVALCAPVGTCGKLFARGLPGQWSIESTLDVSPSPTYVTVPGARCSPYVAAREEMQGAGLVVPEDRRTRPEPSYLVASQAPASGAAVTAGTEVTFYAALVPPVVGLDYPSASTLIDGACGTPVVSGDTAGTVTLQSPSPMSAIPADRLVALVLTKSVPPPPLPPRPPPWWKPLLLPAGVVCAVLIAALVGVALRARRPSAESRAPRRPAGVRSGPVTAGYPDEPPTVAGIQVRADAVRQPTTYWIEEET
jgi:hypothetical protein